MIFDDCLLISLVAAAEILLFRFAYLQRQARRGDDASSKRSGNTVA